MDKHGVAHIICILYRSKHMDASEMGRRGAAITNKLLTTEKRRRAAKKGWKLRKQKLLLEKNKNK